MAPSSITRLRDFTSRGYRVDPMVALANARLWAATGQSWRTVLIAWPTKVDLHPGARLVVRPGDGCSSVGARSGSCTPTGCAIRCG